MSWIQTFTGRAFYPLNPRVEDVDILDIAHALSMLCRYNGHCRFYYSVAEHSCRVHDLLESQGHDPQTCLWGLLHDASEAYLGDMVRPLKHQPGMAAFREAEARVTSTIMQRFGLPEEEPAVVKHADNVILASEKNSLMGPAPQKWSPLPDPIRFNTTLGWDPSVARNRFLQRFKVIQS